MNPLVLAMERVSMPVIFKLVFVSSPQNRVLIKQGKTQNQRAQFLVRCQKWQ